MLSSRTGKRTGKTTVSRWELDATKNTEIDTSWRSRT